MHRKLLLISALLALSFASASCAETHNYTAGDVIVVLSEQDNSGTFRASELASGEGFEVRKVYSALSENSGSVFALIHSDDIDPEIYAQELMNNPNVIAASPNYIVMAASVTPNDTYWPNLWGLQTINMPEVWESEKGSASVYVAIIDSGIDWTNEELASNVVSELGKNTLNSLADAMDDYGHGTHVAGTIGALSNNNFGVTGINWNVKMIPIKALDNNGYGSTDTVIAGINHVIDLLNQGYNIRVVNLSLETYASYKPDSYSDMQSFPLWHAFKNLDNINKTVIVSAAGNNKVTVGHPTTGYKRSSNGSIVYRPGEYVYPASFTGINNLISVSAMNYNRKVASYSNNNASISAPGGESSGEKILSTWPSARFSSSDGSKLFEAFGTSMASPHVAGVAALLSAHNSSMTAYQIKQCIMETRNNNYAEGLLDAAAALKYQDSQGTSLVPEGNGELKTYENPNSDSGGSSGCNGMFINASFLAGVFMLVKKFMN